MFKERAINIERQKRAGWCLLACARVALEYYGENRSQEELREVFGTTQEHGTDIYHAVAGFQELGYEVRYKTNASILDLDRCLRAELPTIVCWWHDLEGEPEGHYSLVENISIEHSPKASHSNMTITLLDPELGDRRVMPFEEFKKRWWSKENGQRIEQPLIIIGGKISERTRTN